MYSKLRKDYFFYIFLAIIFVYGLIVRYYALVYSHDIFFDEAAILLTIKERTYMQLFNPIVYAHCSPALFLIMGKFIYGHFGINLIALRCIPFFFSILSLFLFVILSFKIFKNKIAICAVNFMFAFSPWILTYQMFFKHYINDVFASVAILLIAYHIKDKPISKKLTALLAFIAVLFALSSYTSILITASTILTLVIYKYNKENQIKILQNGLIFLAIFLAFLIPYFCINMLPAINNRIYDNYWTSFTGSFLPSNIQNTEIILNLLSGNMLKPLFAIALMILSFFTLILRKDKFTLFILFLPFVLAFLLGYLKIYPFIQERTILYIIPLFLLIMVKPIDIYFEGNFTRKKIIVSIFAVIFFLLSLNISEIKRITLNLASGNFTNITNNVYETRYKKERTSNVKAALKLFKKYGIKKTDYILIKYANHLVYELYDKERIINLDNIHALWDKGEEDIAQFNSIPIDSTIYMYISDEYDDIDVFEFPLEYCKIELQVNDGKYKLIKAKKLRNIEQNQSI